jgi:hypothetical protein
MAKQASRIPNPLALNMYVLGYNSRKKLVNLNQAVKENLRTYLGQYRMVTDAINIKNAYVINIGVKFSIMTRPNYNKNEVLVKAIEIVKTFFEIDRWQVNQPIILADLVYQLSLVDGVSAVVPPKEDNIASNPIIIENKYKASDGYSGNLYDIEAATKNGIIYPSLDPSIFELKFPAADIQGRVVGDM